jgi:chemotaxis protein histidine kinase CheA
MSEMDRDGHEITTDWLTDARRIYLAGATRKLAELERAICGLQMNPTSLTHERRLRLLLHNLIGSGASYGFPSVTETARRMSETLCHRRETQSTSDDAVINDLLASLARLREIFGEARA